MPGVPMDPYSDQPLRMIAIEGKPVIYSVGRHGTAKRSRLGVVTT